MLAVWYYLKRFLSSLKEFVKYLENTDAKEAVCSKNRKSRVTKDASRAKRVTYKRLVTCLQNFAQQKSFLKSFFSFLRWQVDSKKGVEGVRKELKYAQLKSKSTANKWAFLRLFYPLFLKAMNFKRRANPLNSHHLRNDRMTSICALTFLMSVPANIMTQVIRTVWKNPQWTQISTKKVSPIYFYQNLQSFKKWNFLAFLMNFGPIL